MKYFIFAVSDDSKISGKGAIELSYDEMQEIRYAITHIAIHLPDEKGNSVSAKHKIDKLIEQ